MKKLVTFLLMLIAGVAMAQPTVRIPASEFAEVLDSHPYLWTIKKEALADHTAGATTTFSSDKASAFKQNAFFTFLRCWTLEMQIRDLKNYQETILALKVEESTLLLKQQLLALEAVSDLKKLEFEYQYQVSRLNSLTQHRYGAQPVLPEGWVWDAASGADGEQVLRDKLTDLNGLIGLEEKFISKLKSQEPYMMLVEYAQLKSYKQQRWDTLVEIARLQSYTMAAAPKGLPKDSGSN